MTAAGFLRPRLRQFLGRRICRPHLLGRSYLAWRRGWWPWCSRPTSACNSSFERQPDQGDHDPHAIYETRTYRALRRLIEWCMSGAARSCWRPSVSSRSQSSASASCSSNSSRSPSGPSCSSSCACPKEPPSAPRSNPSRRRRPCSRATRIFRPTRPMSAAAHRASGLASIRSCRTNPSQRS